MKLSINEVCEITGISYSGILIRIRRGTLKAKKKNGHWRINRKELKTIRKARKFEFHGQSKCDNYYRYVNMVRRCYDPDNHNYPRYGARGVTVCERWLNSFQAFNEDMGQCPPGMTLDRKDNDGPYDPDNCRWATDKQQRANRGDSK